MQGHSLKVFYLFCLHGTTEIWEEKQCTVIIDWTQNSEHANMACCTVFACVIILYIDYHSNSIVSLCSFCYSHCHALGSRLNYGMLYIWYTQYTSTCTYSRPGYWCSKTWIFTPCPRPRPWVASMQWVDCKDCSRHFHQMELDCVLPLTPPPWGEARFLQYPTLRTNKIAKGTPTHPRWF